MDKQAQALPIPAAQAINLGPMMQIPEHLTAVSCAGVQLVPVKVNGQGQMELEIIVAHLLRTSVVSAELLQQAAEEIRAEARHCALAL
jgi:hypothetical protein